MLMLTQHAMMTMSEPVMAQAIGQLSEAAAWLTIPVEVREETVEVEVVEHFDHVIVEGDDAIVGAVVESENEQKVVAMAAVKSKKMMTETMTCENSPMRR